MGFENIKAISFDFWGVVVDIDLPIYQYLRHCGVPPEKYLKEIYDLVIKHDLGEITEKQFMDKCSQIMGFEIPYPRCRCVYDENSLNKNLIDIIRKLRTKYKIALISNSGKEYCDEYLFGPNFDQFFDVLVLSYQIGYRKPEPEFYRILIKKLSLKPEEILLVDDDATKLPAAEALGIKTLQYKGEETDEALLSLIQNQ